MKHEGREDVQRTRRNIMFIPSLRSLRIFAFQNVFSLVRKRARVFLIPYSRIPRSKIGAKYCPVYEFLLFTMSSGVPLATIVPPRLPPSGPKSIT
jgi:hypothetical protein